MKPPAEAEGQDKKLNLLERYALLCFRRPRTVFFSIVASLIILTVICGAFFALSTTEGNEWLIKDDEQTQRDRAIDGALEDFGEASGLQPRRSEKDSESTMTFIFKARDKNIFTEENLASLYESEKVLWGNPKFKEFCQLDYGEDDTSDPVCVKPLSLLNLFYEYNDETAEYGDRVGTIEDGIAKLKADIFRFGFHVDSTFNGTDETEFTRSQYYFGLPVSDYTNSYKDDDDQVDFIKENFLEEVEDDLWDFLGMKSKLFRTAYAQIGKAGNLEVIFFSISLNEDEFTRVVQTDFLWAFLSIFSVWVYMLVHLGSVFLATVGIFEVFMSFPAAYVLYRVVFQIEYFDFLHLLVIFILLGIGADDVFVFTDAFKQSKCVKGIGRSLQARLVYTTKRAAKAVFVTSFTTVAAFLATATSSLMPMQSFGIFAALCIAFLFLVNVLLMPAAIVLWSGYTPWCVQKLCCCFGHCHDAFDCSSKIPCCSCCHIDPDETFDLPMGNPISDRMSAPGSLEMVGTYERNTSGVSVNAADESNQQETKVTVEKTKTEEILEEDVTQLRSLERFFNGKYFNFILKARWVLVAMGVIAFIGGLVLVSTFEPPSSAEQWWPSYHSFNKFTKWMDRDGPFIESGEDDVAEVHLVWGLDGMSNNYARFDPDDFGGVEYDDTFDMSSEAAQTHLLEVCQDVRVAKCRDDAKECRRGGPAPGYLVLLDRSDGAAPFKDQAPCWIEKFDDWLKNSTDATEGLPLAPAMFLSKLRDFANTSMARIEFPNDIGLVEVDGVDTLQYVQFKFDATYRPPSSYRRTKPVMNSWEDFMDAKNALAEEDGLVGVNKGFQSGRWAWTWVETQQALLKNALQGVILVFVLAFVVLNVATQNLVISSIAISSVAGIVATVMGIGIRGVMDWKLGVAESIVSVILIGFSMDYTLHLADAYVESQHSDRNRRTQDSLTHLGISVTAGALTTLISGLFLWFTVLTFFTKFAFNITATIITSYLWSIMFFPAMCLTFGPEGDFGNWSAMLAKIGLTKERLCCFKKK
ncbi:hypothetical protein BSKO_07739 [Bryopsis sp. KO-2023]|nr:hypothetical protein BSKO_07739 [Bryopsis sp. KO-2023]